MSRVRLIHAIAFTMLALSPFGLAADGFALTDRLNRQWRNELVRFALDGPNREAALAGVPLVGPDGRATPYQVIDDKLVFAANLEPLATSQYRFMAGAGAAASDLRVEEDEQTVKLHNGRTGIVLRRTLKPGEGPIAGVRLSSGAWAGDSRLAGAPAAKAVTLTVLEHGPALATARVEVEFADGSRWTMTVSLQAGEPIVLVDEVSTAPSGPTLELSLAQGFTVDRVLWRPSSGTVAADPLAGGPTDPTVFKLQPWTSWGPPRQGKWFGLYRKDGPDLLFMGARDGDRWVDLARPTDRTVKVERRGDEVVAELALARGERRWLIGALPAAECLAEAGKVATPLPQRYLIKHEFPLDKVKDYVLEWPADETRYPRLYLTPDQVVALRRDYRVDAAELARLGATPVSKYDLEPWILAYLATGDAAVGRQLVTAAIDLLQQSVDMQLNQVSNPWLGRAPHAQTDILVAMSAADAVLGTPAVTPEETRRIRAQTAFLGYTVVRPDYWSPLHGFGANANMTSHVAAYQVIAGCLIPTHPQARAWVETGLRELKEVELDHWSDTNGGWVEAPGYALVTLNYLVGSFVAARNSGYPDYTAEPQLRKVYGWLAKLSTPPDARLLNTRHLPPIGNTWKLAWVGDFGLMANLWRQSHPKLAAEMAWMHQQHNAYTSKVGGFAAAMAGHRVWLSNTSGIEPQAPAYGSELFPETGVILRAHFPSARETMLYLVSGEHLHHYDFESGSIQFWGKGRIVADGFGYYTRSPVADHSMLELPLMQNVPMATREFATGPRLDYVRASLAPAPPVDAEHVTDWSYLDYLHAVASGWTRQIVFVKDADPMGANYMVMADTLRQPLPATWRLWFAAERVDLGEHGATVIGREDVDTDVLLYTDQPAKVRTEDKTRATSGYNPEAKYGRWEWTQTGLIASSENARLYLSVLFPRLKTDPPMRAEVLANGRAVKIVTAAGTDYVFLANAPFGYEGEGIRFEGTAATIQLRGEKGSLSLGAPGELSYNTHHLEAEAPAHLAW